MNARSRSFVKAKTVIPGRGPLQNDCLRTRFGVLHRLWWIRYWSMEAHIWFLTKTFPLAGATDSRHLAMMKSSDAYNIYLGITVFSGDQSYSIVYRVTTTQRHIGSKVLASIPAENVMKVSSGTILLTVSGKFIARRACWRCWRLSSSYLRGHRIEYFRGPSKHGSSLYH